MEFTREGEEFTFDYPESFINQSTSLFLMPTIGKPLDIGHTNRKVKKYLSTCPQRAYNLLYMHAYIYVHTYLYTEHIFIYMCTHRSLTI